MYNILMRTNIVLDKNLVNEALELSDAKSMREVVDRALQEYVARRRQKDLLKLRGAGWDGNLKEMRKGRVGSY
jgi:Arc/MetJ family transcription regulator